MSGGMPEVSTADAELAKTLDATPIVNKARVATRTRPFLRGPVLISMSFI